VGKNDLKTLSPKQVAEGISANLGKQLAMKINQESLNTDIALSSIIPRTDNPHLAAKATEDNKLTNSLCAKNKWKFINHSSITSISLSDGFAPKSKRNLFDLLPTTSVISFRLSWSYMHDENFRATCYRDL
jgi:hypothetical protein